MAIRHSCRGAALTACLLIGLAAPTAAGAGERHADVGPRLGASGERDCRHGCGPIAGPSGAPVPAGYDCHWEHVRVPADRFTVLVRRVRVCY